MLESGASLRSCIQCMTVLMMCRAELLSVLYMQYTVVPYFACIASHCAILCL
jgi:hypothetical protein